MDVYDFLGLAAQLADVIVSVYDCNSETVVYTGEVDREPICDIEEQMENAGTVLYSEVEGYDIFKDKEGHIHLELNISIEED